MATNEQMREIEATRLARMTHTERAQHENIKREMLEARRGPGLGIKFMSPPSEEGLGWANTMPLKEPDVDSYADRLIKVMRDNARRMEDSLMRAVAPDMNRAARDILMGNCPDVVRTPGLLSPGWRTTSVDSDRHGSPVEMQASTRVRIGGCIYEAGDIIRRKRVTDSRAETIAYADVGAIGPVTRPRDGTAYDYVVAAGQSITHRGHMFEAGETIPKSINSENICRLAGRGVIRVAE